MEMTKINAFFLFPIKPFVDTREARPWAASSEVYDAMSRSQTKIVFVFRNATSGI